MSDYMDRVIHDYESDDGLFVITVGDVVEDAVNGHEEAQMLIVEWLGRAMYDGINDGHDIEEMIGEALRQRFKSHSRHDSGENPFDIVMQFVVDVGVIESSNILVEEDDFGHYLPKYVEWKEQKLRNESAEPIDEEEWAC